MVVDISRNFLRLAVKVNTSSERDREEPQNFLAKQNKLSWWHMILWDSSCLLTKFCVCAALSMEAYDDW